MLDRLHLQYGNKFILAKHKETGQTVSKFRSVEFIRAVKTPWPAGFV